ncbi:MAG: hypothetical protein WAX80_03310 [Minisyncoccia bacterium]
MKKLIVVVVLILLAGGIYYVLQDKPSTKTETPTTNESGNFRPDPSNATFNFEDGPVTLTAGRKEIAVGGSALTEEVVLMDEFAYGDINADGKEDTALLLARYGAGSGTFIYVAAFVSGPVNYKGSLALFIGDRVSPESISIGNGVVTVNYLDREADEPMAAEPTVPMSKQFIYINGQLQER